MNKTTYNYCLNIYSLIFKEKLNYKNVKKKKNLLWKKYY